MAEKLIQQRIFFFGMVAVLAVLALILVWPFITAILFAVAVVVIITPLYNRFLRSRWARGSSRRATIATLVVFVLLIAIPVLMIVGGAISQANRLLSGIDIESFQTSLPDLLTRLEEGLKGTGTGVQIDREQLLLSMQQAASIVVDWFLNLVVSLGATIPALFTNALIVLVIMYVMLPAYKNPDKQAILDFVPFPREITQLFLDKIDLMITGMFRGIFVIAIVQGAAMGLVLLIAGVPFAMLLTLISMFLSLVPLVGISLVAWPVGILLIVGGNVWQGIFVIGAFVLVVANIDTILRPYLVPKGAYLNPALIVLSVFGGLSLMGIIGILYGPVIMILLVTCLEVYTKYILRSDLVLLQQEGRINLEELGLVPDDVTEDQKLGSVFLKVVKNISAPFQRISFHADDDTSSGGEQTEILE